jgi:hypothetical protein
VRRRDGRVHGRVHGRVWEHNKRNPPARNQLKYLTISYQFDDLGGLGGFPVPFTYMSLQLISSHKRSLYKLDLRKTLPTLPCPVFTRANKSLAGSLPSQNPPTNPPDLPSFITKMNLYGIQKWIAPIRACRPSAGCHLFTCPMPGPPRPAMGLWHWGDTVGLDGTRLRDSARWTP